MLSCFAAIRTNPCNKISSWPSLLITLGVSFPNLPNILRLNGFGNGDRECHQLACRIARRGYLDGWLLASAARTRSRERPNLMHCRFVCLPSRAGRTLSPLQAGPFAAGWISKQVHCIKARARDQKGLWSSPFSQGLAGAPTGDSFTLFPSTGQKLHLHRRLGRRRRICLLLAYLCLSHLCPWHFWWVDSG